MKEAKVGSIFLFLSLAILVSSPFVFAGFGEFWAKITGRPTSATTSVSITVGNTAPVVYFANVTVPLSGSGTSPSEAVGLLLYVIFNATDADGVNTLVNASAKATLNYSGDFYTSTSCTFVSANSSSYQYNCTIPLPYYASPATYSLNASIADQNNARATLWAPTWALGTLKAMTMTPTSLSWSSISTSTVDAGADNDPIAMNNTGNDNALAINVTAYDIRGFVSPTSFIYANNFTVHNITEGCNVTAFARVLSNATSLGVNNATLNRGSNTTYGAEDIYFCLKGILSTTPADTYNLSTNSWTVAI